MAAIDLVTSPKKRMLLCYIALGPALVGYPSLVDGTNWGYVSLPRRMKELITCEVFLELMEQLLLERLVERYQKTIVSRYEDVLVSCWRATAIGRRVARTLFGADLNKVSDVNHSIDSFDDLIVTKFAASSSLSK